MNDAAPSRRPLRRGSLSRERIVDAAVELVERDGVDALTMRRLAAHIGCEPMSLYKHVDHKDALVELVVEQVLADFEPPAAALDWRDRLRGIGAELRRIAIGHPHVFPLLALRLPSTSVALAPVEATLVALRSSGLRDDDVVSAFWALTAYTTGALLAETAATVGVDQPFPFGLDGVDASAAPTVVELAALLACSDWRTEYERGLEMVLGSIASSVSRSRGGRR